MRATDIHPKVAAAGAAGLPAAVVLIWVAGLLGVDMPAEVAAALAALVATAAGYLMPSGGTGRRRLLTTDDGESFSGAAWTVLAVLGCVALVIWIAHAL